VHLFPYFVGQPLKLSHALVSDEDTRVWRVNRISPLDLSIEVLKDSADSSRL
jgi:hypothetical protein